MLVLCLLFTSFSLLVSGNPCTDGYKQAPNGGDCFKAETPWTKLSYDGGDEKCAGDGGMLASIHSKEEADFIYTSLGCPPTYMMEDEGGIIPGLRCIGNDCKWDDGTPFDYSEFSRHLPSDGDQRCLYIQWDSWQVNDCSSKTKACWVCRQSALRITCKDGETAYGGGCISVHTEPLDMKSAEATCNEEGGHLISIHGNTAFYADLARKAGLNNTFLIGAEFVNGVFGWLDGTRYTYNAFPAPFPDTIFGLCVQVLLFDEFATAGSWTNIPCSNKLPYMCMRYRDGPAAPTETPEEPKPREKCEATNVYTGSGIFHSPNYPFSITPRQNCEYVLAVAEGGRVSLNFTSYDCESGTTLSLFDGLNTLEPFITFDDIPSLLNVPYVSTNSVMKMHFVTQNKTVGMGFEAEFHQV